ncbi:hypothetical protein PR048_006877 [Dryococelus australis]|uniref:Uncharacterized protein n=1 Tax=Dryococelus australis TaxID=614101 RepID=A0ABQ9IDH4_9NEOP|nr:hypothetical protein PR048_006877 [Dryococelus australis]
MQGAARRGSRPEKAREAGRTVRRGDVKENYRWFLNYSPGNESVAARQVALEEPSAVIWTCSNGEHHPCVATSVSRHSTGVPLHGDLRLSWVLAACGISHHNTADLSWYATPSGCFPARVEGGRIQLQHPQHGRCCIPDHWLMSQDGLLINMFKCTKKGHPFPFCNTTLIRSVCEKTVAKIRRIVEHLGVPLPSRPCDATSRDSLERLTAHARATASRGWRMRRYIYPPPPFVKLLHTSGVDVFGGSAGAISRAGCGPPGGWLDDLAPGVVARHLSRSDRAEVGARPRKEVVRLPVVVAPPLTVLGARNRAHVAQVQPIRPLASHKGKHGSTPGGVDPGFSHVGIVLADAAGWRIFSGICRFPRPCVPVPHYTHTAPP